MILIVLIDNIFHSVGNYPGRGNVKYKYIFFKKTTTPKQNKFFPSPSSKTQTASGHAANSDPLTKCSKHLFVTFPLDIV